MGPVVRRRLTHVATEHTALGPTVTCIERVVPCHILRLLGLRTSRFRVKFMRNHGVWYRVDDGSAVGNNCAMFLDEIVAKTLEARDGDGR